MRSDSEREYVEYVSARLAKWHRAAYVMCGDADRAEDVVQATVTTLYRHWRRATTADNLDAYVHRMLVRHFLNERRLGWSRVLLLDETPDRPDVVVDDRLDTRHDLLAGLARLPKGQRAVLVLRFLCDLSVDDTAAVLRCSTGNVKAQTSRGIEAMRAHLGDNGTRRLPHLGGSGTRRLRGVA
jgi:RNA polymerase sigma-70 factor (sigma-E family)